MEFISTITIKLDSLNINQSYTGIVDIIHLNHNYKVRLSKHQSIIYR
jgi:hypothetical protein